MTERNQELAIAEARLMIAACVYVDGAEHGDDTRQTWQDLSEAVAAYRAALRGLPMLPADHPLVEKGMAVVRRLLDASP